MNVTASVAVVPSSVTAKTGAPRTYVADGLSSTEQAASVSNAARLATGAVMMGYVPPGVVAAETVPAAKIVTASVGLPSTATPSVATSGRLRASMRKTSLGASAAEPNVADLTVCAAGTAPVYAR